MSDKVPSATNIKVSNLNLVLMEYENAYFEYERQLADQDEDVGREAGEDETTPNDAYALFDTPTKDQDETVEGGLLDDAQAEVDPTFETPTQESLKETMERNVYDAYGLFDNDPQDDVDPMFKTPTEELERGNLDLPLACDGRDCEGHDANGIFDILMSTQFIHASNTHLEEYGCAMDILVFDNEKGAHICEILQCPRCRKCMELHSSRMIKTPVLEPDFFFKITTIY